MKKRNFLLLALVLCLGIGVAFAEDYDIAGAWNLSGNGYVEKSVIRVSLELNGDLEVITKMGDVVFEEYSDDVEAVAEILRISEDRFSETGTHLNDIRFVTGHVINLEITATNLDISAWSDHIDNSRLSIPVPLPELRPSNDNPFVLPKVSHAQDDSNLEYTVTLTSIYSGTVRIHGWFELDIVNDVDLDSLCKIWKFGTDEPASPGGDNKSSGCNSSGFGIMSVIMSMLMIFAIFGVKGVRNICSGRI